MKLLLRHCDILAAGETGFRALKDAYLGIDGDTIDYIGTEEPKAACPAVCCSPASSTATGTAPWCSSGAWAATCPSRSGCSRR